MTYSTKFEVVRKALEEGLIDDRRWLDHPDEPMPAWLVLEIALKLIDRLDPPYIGFD